MTNQNEEREREEEREEGKREGEGERGREEGEEIYVRETQVKKLKLLKS
jgi:hypothetical protein